MALAVGIPAIRLCTTKAGWAAVVLDMVARGAPLMIEDARRDRRLPELSVRPHRVARGLASSEVFLSANSS